MPQKSKLELKGVLERLAQTSDDDQRAELIRQFSVALEAKLVTINNQNAATIGRIENDLREELSALHASIAELRSLILDNRSQAGNRIHQTNNFVMALENKIDELSQLIMRDYPLEDEQ